MIEPAAARLRAFDGVAEKASWGERAFFVNPGNRLPNGTYFATIKTADGPNDRASRLHGGRWRLNLGLPKPLYRATFGQSPTRPAKGATVLGPWDFAAADVPMPHPVYGWMGWVAIVNPSPATLDALAPWLEAAYDKAMQAALARIAKLERPT